MRKIFYVELIFIIFFLVLRLVNLGLLPIFTDEAIYIRWTQIANQDPAWRFISLTDGKQPLFIWLNMISQRIFSEPLFAGRIISVLAAIFSTVGIYFLGKELFGKKIGLYSGLIWAILPFAFWHERLALMDSLLATFAIWCLFLQVRLCRKPILETALLFGIVAGGGLLTKSSALFFLLLLPLGLLVTEFPTRKSFIAWLIFIFIGVFIAQILNSVQRLSPFFYIVGQKNLTFIYSFKEIMSFSLPNTWQRFWGNITGLSNWLYVYLTPGFIFLIILALADLKKNIREKLFLTFWFLIPFIALAFFGKVIYPRFILFMIVPLVVLVAKGLEKINLILAVLIFIYPIYFNFQTVFNPVETPLPPVDRGQYLDDWPAGWGIKEVIAYLNEKSQSEKIVLGTEGTFGLTPYAFEIYLWRNQNIEIKGFWPISTGIGWLEAKSLQKTTYLVLKDTQKPDPAWKIELIAKYKRGKGENYLGFYKLKQ